LDIEFYTYNEMSYRDGEDENGNSDFRKADYGRGRTSSKFKRKKIQYVYKCKWIIGTDKCYDFGMCYDQKRVNEPKKKAKTKLSFHFAAYNFYEMKAQAFMDRLVPFLDEYQLTVLKIQNFKNRAVPSGWWIDLDALENVALNKGGANMQPKELLQMFFETGVLVGRSKDAQGQAQSPNWKPVIPIENTAASELAMFYQDLLVTINAIEKIVGTNDIVNGNPNPKTLVPGYELANQSTADALYPMAWAEEFISLQLAEAVLCRMQQGLKKGGISGYAPALNSNMLHFIQLNPDIAWRDYGIELEKKTSEEQRVLVLQQMQGDIANGFLSSSDAVMLIMTKNIKQIVGIWNYRVRKAKEQAHKQQMELVNAQTQGNSMIAQQAAQADQQKMMMELQGRLKEKEMTIQGELAKEELRINAEMQIKLKELEMKYQMNRENNLTDIQEAHITHDAKVVSTVIAGEHSIEKQEIANKKPKPAGK
jgi:hypothetical protein